MSAVPPILFAFPALRAPPPPDVTLGDGTSFTATSSAATHTLATHDCSTGDILVRFTCRSNNNPTIVPSLTWNGVAVPLSVSGKLDGSGRMAIGIGVLAGAATGVNDLVLSGGGNTITDVCMRVDDLVDLPATFEGATPTPTVQNVSQDNVSVGITTEALDSLLVGVAGALHGSADPFTTTGWTQQATIDTGSAADTDNATVFVSKAGGAASTAHTLTASSATTTDDWAAAALELLKET